MSNHAHEEEKDTFAGERLLVALGNLLRTVKIHDDNNTQTLESVANFARCVVAACGEEQEKATLHISSDRFYLGEEKLLHHRNVVNLLDYLLAYFAERELPGLSFHQEISQAPAQEVIDFARLLNAVGSLDTDRLSALKARLGNLGVIWAEIFEPAEGGKALEETRATVAEDAEKEAGLNLRARKNYSYAMAGLHDLAMKLAEGQRPGVGKLVRVMQNMVNILTEDETVLLGLSSLRIYDDYTYSHSVNVAMLSMCLGKSIGLSRRALEKLGLAAIFHDLGKLDIPKKIITKADKLTDSEYNLIKSHTLHSVRQIIMLRASQKRKSQILLPPFEHHMKFDHSGYPSSPRRSLSLFGRIIAIADVYDAITSPRVYRQSLLSPDRALVYMKKKEGTDFDPILLKIFLKMLGLYPVGTLVKLDTGEIAIVSSAPLAGSDDCRPGVVLLERDYEGRFMKTGRASLAERDEQTGAYLRSVVRTYHPAEFNIQPAQFLF